MASIVGKALRGFGRALKKKSKSKWVKDKGGTIKGVKPFSGKEPWYVRAGPNTPKSRKEIILTHAKVKKSDKINKLEKQIEEGKEGLEKMVDTKQAKEFKNYKGKGTGKHFRTGTD